MTAKDIARLSDQAYSQSLDRLFNPKTGQYYAPYNPTFEEWHARRIEQLLSAEELAIPLQDVTIAVLDTGVLTHHPGLRGRIVGSVDFTGEGPEDRNGHGTTVALLAVGPIKPSPRILNVKVLDRNGRGDEKSIVAGMRWATENGAHLINMSLCIYRSCDGTCALCVEAKAIAAAGTSIVLAAAGNEGPTVAACPAQCCDAVIAVGAADYTWTNNADYSGRGDRYYPGTVDFVPVDENDLWSTDQQQ